MIPCIDWDKLKYLVDDGVPPNLDPNQKKKTIQPKEREAFEERDSGVCYLCNKKYPYGSNNMYLRSHGQNISYKVCHLHHVIPNGDTHPYNIVTLCTHCHQVVHQLLYIGGKWKFSRPM